MAEDKQLYFVQSDLTIPAFIAGYTSVGVCFLFLIAPNIYGNILAFQGNASPMAIFILPGIFLSLFLSLVVSFFVYILGSLVLNLTKAKKFFEQILWLSAVAVLMVTGMLFAIDLFVANSGFADDNGLTPFWIILLASIPFALMNAWMFAWFAVRARAKRLIN